MIVDSSNFPTPNTYSSWFYNELTQRSFSTHIKRLFNGDALNTSEQRAALHSALRHPAHNNALSKSVQYSLDRMSSIVDELHNQTLLGSTGKPITNVIHLGVGGSYLGPKMACHALDEFKPPNSQHIQIHFAPSMDGTDIDRLLRKLNPETCLFVIASKSFSTLDTLQNSTLAKRWLTDTLKQPEHAILSHHFIGCSADEDKMSAWGIADDKQLLLWNWVGGRYSIWSVIGLPIAILIGMTQFREFLAGAHKADEHFQNTPLTDNTPVSMALNSTWAISQGYTANAILPYDGRLTWLAEHLQQLIMESNGKSTTIDGNPCSQPTSPIIFGGNGTNVQHSIFQLLHQGMQQVYCDFILIKNRFHPSQTSNPHSVEQHKHNIKQALAQSVLLHDGDYLNIGKDHIPVNQPYPGGTPSTLLILDTLSPHSLGQLLATYEHKTFVEAFIWNINPFDQWGVELGKQYANRIDLDTDISSNHTTLNKLLTYFQ